MQGELRLPKNHRPDFPYRKCVLGIDVPREFYDELRQIDENFYLVFHAYRVLWDSIINSDVGELEDPRYQIHYKYGELNFGFVLTDGEGRPIEDGSWHIWRLCDPYGWAHIVKLESRDPDYLKLIVDRLNLQACWTNKYGFRSYNKLLDNVEQSHREQLKKDREELFNAVHTENKWLLDKAADNMLSGKVNPTNPTRDQVISYPGQANRSRIVRPLDDHEGGLYLPE